jgi:hypothetical protein
MIGHPAVQSLLRHVPNGRYAARLGGQGAGAARSLWASAVISRHMDPAAGMTGPGVQVRSALDR